MPFCASCGRQLSSEVAFCPDCSSPAAVQVGVSAAQETTAHGNVNVWAAVVLSVVFPGLGQLHAGEKRRGAVFMGAGLVAVGAIAIQVGIVIYPVLLLVNAFDVRRSAMRMNSENGAPPSVSPGNGGGPLEEVLARDGM